MFRKMTAVVSLVGALAGVAPGLAHAEGWRGDHGDRRGEVTYQDRGGGDRDGSGDRRRSGRDEHEMSRWERRRWRHAMMRRQRMHEMGGYGFGYGYDR